MVMEKNNFSSNAKQNFAKGKAISKCKMINLEKIKNEKCHRPSPF